MKTVSIHSFIIFTLAVTAAVTLWLWCAMGSPVNLVMRVPGMDNAGEDSNQLNSRTGPEGKLITASSMPEINENSGSWSGFRGGNYDNISQEPFTPYPKNAEFPVQWEIEVGEGYASPVIWNGRVYLLDYDRENKADALRCISLLNGLDIWRYTYPVNVKRNHGMSRTIPTITENSIVSLGPKCNVTCLNPLSGEKKWSLDLVQSYDTEVPPWYAGQCPLIDGSRVILAPGGTALMIAVDCESGETVWETPNPHGWKMTHSSIMPMTLNGKKMYVYCASGGVVGVSADNGSILWETTEWTIRLANVPSPLMIAGNRIFLCGGYDAGSMMLQLNEKDGQTVPETLFRLSPQQFGSAQQTPILYQDHIYGVRPDGQLVCMDLKGSEMWSSASAYKFGLGPYMIAGSILHVMDDSGLLSRVEAASSAFRLIDQKQVLHGHDAWGPIAFASGKMILRDLTKMICIEVGTVPPV